MNKREIDDYITREDIEFDLNPEGVSQGRLARLDGKKQTDNPYLNTDHHHMMIAWNDGWVDADQGLLADEEASDAE